jgi:hypothetical protein
MDTLIKIIIVVALAIVLVILMPLAVIWSVNTLFPTQDIPYTLDTWSAIVVLGIFLRANVTVKK